jgi:cobalt-precorrin 5A hydrolase/precorrin-3B C17-methyltransferase
VAVGLPPGDLEIACTMGPSRAALRFAPQRVTLGVGCARGCAPEELGMLVQAALKEARVTPEAIAAVGTLDLKADEGAVLQLARDLGVPLRLFDAAALERETPRLQTPSETVFAELGCHGVAEGAALALAGAEGRLLVAKRKTANATCAWGSRRSPSRGWRGGHGGGCRWSGSGRGRRRGGRRKRRG